MTKIAPTIPTFHCVLLHRITIPPPHRHELTCISHQKTSDDNSYILQYCLCKGKVAYFIDFPKLHALSCPHDGYKRDTADNTGHRGFHPFGDEWLQPQYLNGKPDVANAEGGSPVIRDGRRF
jgi:hypothetical protein